MQKIYEDLYQTRLVQAFGSLNTHAYFLTLKKHNVLFYNTNDKNDLQEIQERGGITFQYLSHRHESTPSLSYIKKTFHSKLCADACEQPFIEANEKVDVVFKEDEIHKNIQVIRTPGHTTGGTSYMYTSEITGKKYLFIGDTLFFWDGALSTILVSHDGGLKKILCESLKKLRTITPDVVICSASIGDTNVQEMTEEQWHKALDWNINKLSH